MCWNNAFFYRGRNEGLGSVLFPEADDDPLPIPSPLAQPLKRVIPSPSFDGTLPRTRLPTREPNCEENGVIYVLAIALRKSQILQRAKR